MFECKQCLEGTCDIHTKEYAQKCHEAAKTDQPVERSDTLSLAEKALFYLKYSHGCWCTSRDPAEEGQHSLGCDYARAAMNATKRESVALKALQKIDVMLGNAIGAGAVRRGEMMSEADSRFFWIFDITKEALTQIEGGKP